MLLLTANTLLPLLLPVARNSPRREVTTEIKGPVYYTFKFNLVPSRRVPFFSK